MKQKIRSNLYLEIILAWEMDYRSLTGLKKKRRVLNQENELGERAKY